MTQLGQEGVIKVAQPKGGSRDFRPKRVGSNPSFKTPGQYKSPKFGSGQSGRKSGGGGLNLGGGRKSSSGKSRRL
mgnify:CR=1 FL=1